MEQQEQRKNIGERLKLLGGLTVMVFAVTLALIVGNRLSDEVLGVLAGAVCGVGAAIPTSLLILTVVRQRDKDKSQQAMTAMESSRPAFSQGNYPPVIVVAPPGTQQRSGGGWDGLPPSLSSPAQRDFTVVGGDSRDD